MKVIRGEGGLGSQMTQIALYERLKKNDPQVYFELSGYDIYNQHNGWEVQKIFGMNLNILNHKKKLKKGKIPFFKRKKKRIMRIFNKNYMSYENYYQQWISKESQEKYLDHFNKNIICDFKIDKVFMCIGSEINQEILVYPGNSYYVGTHLSKDLCYGIEKKIKTIFKFPNFENKKNIELNEKYKNKETVSIHIRRGDYLGNPVLGGLGSLKYYKKAIEYIQKYVKDPVFIIFSNDIEWCEKEFEIKEEHVYVDWNKGNESFRDIQLMSLMKNNIITNSNFSWWGAYLNENPNKIVISPEKWFTDKAGQSDKKINLDSWIKIKNY